MTVIEEGGLVSVSGKRGEEHPLLPRVREGEVKSKTIDQRSKICLPCIPPSVTSCRSPRLVDQVQKISQQRILVIGNNALSPSIVYITNNRQ